MKIIETLIVKSMYKSKHVLKSVFFSLRDMMISIDDNKNSNVQSFFIILLQLSSFLKQWVDVLKRKQKWFVKVTKRNLSISIRRLLLLTLKVDYNTNVAIVSFVKK